MYRIGDSVVYTRDKGGSIPYGQVGIVKDISRTPGPLYYRVDFMPSGISWWLKASSIRLADTTLLRALKKHL